MQNLFTRFPERMGSMRGSLLLATAVLAVAGGHPIASPLPSPPRPQDPRATQAILNLVAKIGGTAQTDGSGNIVGLALWNGERPWFGTRHTLVRDVDLQRFAGLSSLVALDLEGTQVTDTGIKH